ncbi:MAG TPA: hypothetical protein VNU27_07705 [Candidatus Acidoferrum sp.]|nr:hypothetical protein [Candidatus Acidoferrum sp.]
MIYVRSRRSIVTLGAAGLACALTFGALATIAMVEQVWPAGLALAVGALGGAGLGGWGAWGLATWPSGKLGLFRDRLVVIQGRHEMRAVWSLIETITLSEPGAWPHVRLTDRLTISFTNEPPLTLKPAQFGLDPPACRDLMIRLRDDSRLRARLPEFDSVRDLAISPVVAGELIEPRL